MKRTRSLLLLTVLTMTLLVFCSAAQADWKPGIRGGAYTDRDSAALGADLLVNISDNWYFNPNVEYVFVDRANLMTFNFDAHYDFATRAPVYFWVGGGPAILYRNPDGPADSNTDLGANLFFGVGFNKYGRVIPYIQPKVILSNDTEFALTFGVRF